MLPRTGSATSTTAARLTFGWPLLLLIALLAVDGLFIWLHRMYLQDVLDARFALTSERSYSEYYEHGKELLLVLLGFVLAVRHRERLYACWTALFAYLLLDDTFQFHEHAGAFVAAALPVRSVFGLRASAAGELVPSALILFVVVSTVIATWPSSSQRARRFSIAVTAALVALGAFGVLVDLVHSLVRRDPWRYRLGMIEEGGEMVTMSAMITVVAAFVRRPIAAPPP